MNDVFSFEESSESRNACCRPHTPPITILRSTFTTRSFLRVLRDLTIETRRPKDTPDDFLIELESIRGNQWKLSGMHAFGNISEQG